VVSPLEVSPARNITSSAGPGEKEMEIPPLPAVVSSHSQMSSYWVLGLWCVRRQPDRFRCGPVCETSTDYSGKLEHPMRWRRTVDTHCIWSSWGFQIAVCYGLSDHGLAQNHLAAWLDVCSVAVVGVGVGVCISNNRRINRAFLPCRMQLIPWIPESPMGLCGDSSHRAAKEEKEEIAFLFHFGK